MNSDPSAFEFIFTAIVCLCFLPLVFFFLKWHLMWQFPAPFPQCDKREKQRKPPTTNVYI